MEKEKEGGADSADGRTEPRLPWEVFPKGVRGAREARARQGRAAQHFAEAGKIDILAKLDELRNEMDRLYRDRGFLTDRVKELEKIHAEAQAQASEVKKKNSLLEQEKANWKIERGEQLDQVQELKDRVEKAEADYSEIAAQLKAARATIAEFGDALDWRKTAAPDKKPKEASKPHR